jgi:hypothetical protein
LLPNLGKNLTSTPAPEVQVIEIRVDGSRLIGVLKNNTAHEIVSAQLVIDLTSSVGTQVGAVDGVVEKIPPSGNKDFQIPITQRGAAFALVREVRAH